MAGCSFFAGIGSIIWAVPKPAQLPVVRRRRGNPNWGKAQPLKSFSAATAFELQVRELGLSPEMYTTSRELKNWCERNKNHHYIPEWLLKAWNISVNPDISTAA